MTRTQEGIKGKERLLRANICNASRLFSTGIFFLVDICIEIHYNNIKKHK